MLVTRITFYVFHIYNDYEEFLLRVVHGGARISAFIYGGGGVTQLYIYIYGIEYYPMTHVQTDRVHYDVVSVRACSQTETLYDNMPFLKRSVKNTHIAL